MATSPLPSLGSPPLQSGGQKQKLPTSGQSGYVTPAVSGIPTASERDEKSEVAHKWAQWLRHPFRFGDPHRFRAGAEIRSGPLVGKVATSPLPSRGSPPLQSGGQNQAWPASWQSSYVTLAVSGIPTASERGALSEVAHSWAKWLRHRCGLGDPHRFRAGRKIRSGPQVGTVATSPLRFGDPHRFRAGAGGTQTWPNSGQSGYVTSAISGILTPAKRGGKYEVADRWAKWLRHPFRLGDPNRFKAGGKIRSGPQVGTVATSPLPSRGSPMLQSGEGESDVAHKWAKWLHHPCRLGDPNRFKAGGKIRSGPQVGTTATSPLLSRGSRLLQSAGEIRRGSQVGKVATSPMPSWGSPALQKGGEKSEVLTSGHSGYVARAVSGISTASERGEKSEMAYKWAQWLRHPCRLGDPHRFGAGRKIRSGPLVGKVATSPVPSRGSQPLQSEAKNQRWPTSGHSGYVTPAVSGIPTVSERGEKSEVAHNWAQWLRHPCCFGDHHCFKARGNMRRGPQVGKVAVSPLTSRGSPRLQSGGQSQRWPACGQNGYVTPAISAIPTVSERGEKSEVAHNWAKWLHHPYVSGILTASEQGGELRRGPPVGKVATSPLQSRGSPPRQSRGEKSEVAHKWAKWLHHPCRLGDPNCFGWGGGNQTWPTSGQSGHVTPAVSGRPTALEGGGGSDVAHKWAKWLHHPCRLGDPHRFRAGGKIRSGPLLGKVATSPLLCRGSPPLQSGAKNQKWPTSAHSGYITPPFRRSPTLQSGGRNQKWPACGESGYVTLAVSGIPTAPKRGAKSDVAHKWAKWLRHPCCLGDPHRFRAGGIVRSGPLLGKVATTSLPSRGSPPFQTGAKNQNCPTSGHSGYVNPAFQNSSPLQSGGGGELRRGPTVGKVATSPLPSRASPPLQSGAKDQKWPTSGQSGYVTLAVSGIPTVSERGEKSEVAHKWEQWLRHPCRLGDPQGFGAGGEIRRGPQLGKVATSPLPSRGSPPLQSGGKIRSGPQVGKVATSPLPSQGSPPLQSGGKNQTWPACGQSGYITPAVSGIPTASERGGKSEVAHKWAKWLRHPCRLRDPLRFRAGGKIRRGPKWAKWLRHLCRLGDPHRCRAGGKIRSGPQVGKVATSPLLSRGSPPFQSGGKNQKWPRSGHSGYVTLAVSGIPTTSERGGKSEVARLWAKWLHHSCRLGDRHCFRAGGKIRSGSLLGKVATSPLPSRGSPPLQSGGQNQKWPTSGQSGYVTPAVSGVATASKRGEKSEVGDKWAQWLRHPCRLGDPHRFRAGGEIRRGPQVGKVAISPLPSRGSPPLQSGEQNQTWPACGQSGYITAAVSGIPTASKRGEKSEVAHSWAKWLRHACRLGDPHRCRAGGEIRSGPQVGKVAMSPLPFGRSPPLQSGAKIRSGPLVGKVATSPLPSRGSPPFQSGAKNQKWSTSGHSGYVTPAVSGITTVSKRGAT